MADKLYLFMLRSLFYYPDFYSYNYSELRDWKM